MITTKPPCKINPSFGMTKVESPSVPALYAFLLGAITSGSIIISVLNRNSSSASAPFAAHIGSLAAFHFLEYYWQAKYNPDTTNSEAFLLNHSKEYLMALIAGLLEFGLRRLLNFGPVWLWMQFLGLCLIFFGIVIRSMAMITANSSFSHDIKDNLGPKHKLVKDGIYGLCRHPSYLGFFSFAVGTQIILGNVFVSAAFVFVLQKFFRERVAYEEAILLKKYPSDYAEYKTRVWSGIPFNGN